MEKEKEEFSFWLDKENKVISFHFEKDAEKMDFKSREDMLTFCCELINLGYSKSSHCLSDIVMRSTLFAYSRFFCAAFN